MPLFSRPPPGVLSWFVGLFLLLPAIGGGDALARAAHDLSPPRVQALRRTSVLILLFLAVTVASVYMFDWLVPSSERNLWVQAPLAGLAQHLGAPAWLGDFLTLALVAAAALLLVPAARSALDDAGLLLQRLSAEGPLADSLARLHSRFGTPSRAINATAAAAVFVMVVSGGQVSWLARAYAMVIVVTLLFKIAALMRLRAVRPGSRAFEVPLTLRAGTRQRSHRSADSRTHRSGVRAGDGLHGRRAVAFHDRGACRIGRSLSWHGAGRRATRRGCGRLRFPSRGGALARSHRRPAGEHSRARSQSKRSHSRRGRPEVLRGSGHRRHDRPVARR